MVDSLLGYLAAQTLYPKVYWRAEGEGEFAGIGASAYFHTLPKLQEGESRRFFGGWDFWGREGKSFFFLPLIEMEKRDGKLDVRLNRGGRSGRIMLQKERPLRWEGGSFKRTDSPTKEEWTAQVEGARAVRKVVLARASTLLCEREVCPWALLSRLPYSECAYGFAQKAGSAFIGNSPELLYRREGRALRSSALAGTRRRGGAEALYASEKEQRECAIVREAMEKALAPLSSALEVGAQEVVETATLCHLHYPLRAQLRPETSDEQLIAQLHPTPAVAGCPREESLAFIRKCERFDRGWYSAPVGWLSGKGAHLRVGIRSALVEGRRVRLYAGAGLVEGSHAAGEWQELEDKIAQYVQLF